MKIIKNINKEKLLHFFKNNLLVIFGTFVLAIGTELFILPSNLDTGGVSGLAICFKFLGVGLNSETIITILCWSLFFIGLMFLGWSFSIQTLCSTIFYPICLFLLKWVINNCEHLIMYNSPSVMGEEALIILLSSLFGGVFVGAGCGITFLGGGSTGGVDVITFIICKYFKKIKSSVWIFLIDATIIIMGYIFDENHDMALCLEGVFSAFVAAVVIDKVFIGSNQSFVAYIVTDKEKEITKDIIEKIDRTTSIIDIVGGYSNSEKKMLMVSFTIRQYNMLRQIIIKNDRKAFMTIHRAHEITGEGFKPLE